MKGEQFKGGWKGYARTGFDPVKPNSKFPKTISYGYLKPVNGNKHASMRYCVFRHDWLIRTLVNAGVNVKELMPPSTRVSSKKCRKIAYVLEKMRGDDNLDKQLLETDIQFYANCGGLRIPEWTDPY